MQILTIKNPNFEKQFRNPSPSNRTQVNILKKKFLDISPKKFGSAYAQSPRKCPEPRNSGKNRGKEAKFCLKNLPSAYKVLI
jgi:hypothetical protein